MLPGWISAGLRSTTEAFLTERCTVYAETQTIDEYGAPDPQLLVVASHVPCRVIKAGTPNTSAIRSEAGQQETMPHEYRLAVQRETALAVDQVVEVGGEQYRIVRIETALTERFFRSAIIVRR